MLVSVFTTCPRSGDVDSFRERARQTFKLTELFSFTGTLIYTGNDVPVEPWFLAQEMVRAHPRLSPLIAVNPVYMHPFTVARFISAIAGSYARRCHLNLVIGTALRDLEALGEDLSHDDRYARLLEFAEIVVGLCAGPAPLTYSGEHYGVAKLQLRPAVPSSLRPALFVAGHSDSARQTADRLGACRLGMLQPDLALHPAGARGVHVGIICRSTDEEAWRAARQLFPEDARGERMQRFSVQNTDAVWKRRILGLAEEPVTVSDGYWLKPFLQFQVDCPMLVGAQQRIAQVLSQLTAQGIDQFVFELPPYEADYQHVAQALASLPDVHVLRGDAVVRQ